MHSVCVALPIYFSRLELIYYHYSMSGETIFDKLSHLCLEIEEGIRNLPTASDGPVVSGDEERVHAAKSMQEILNSQIEDLRAESYGDRAPEAQYAVLLFRKYAEEANRIRTAYEQVRREGQQNDNSEILADFSIPQYVYEGCGEQLSGWAAMKRNIFWFRTLVALFSMLCIIMIALAPHVLNNGSLKPNSLFTVYIIY